MTDIIDSDSDDELPTGWEERVTLDGKVYYANHSSESTQWTHPHTGKRKLIMGDLPFGWEQTVSDDGSVYYIDHASKKTTFTDPRLAFAVEDTTHCQNTADSPPIKIKPKFDGSSTTEQVLQGVDLTGRYVIVTGANNGIGYETAESLANHGATVTIACRDTVKADTAKARIKKANSKANVHAMKCDLCSLKSVGEFAKNYLDTKWPLHILILNAGIFDPPYSKTDDGFESTFQTNHLGHFLMTKLLTKVLTDSAPARIIVVSSESHRFSNVSHKTLEESLLVDEKSYSGLKAYNLSKLCNVLFSVELNSRLYCHRVTCNAIHPGNMISTNISRSRYLWRTLFFIVRPFTKNTNQGASTTVYCSASSDLEGVGGLYFNNCWQCHPSDEITDKRLRATLWKLSEDCLAGRVTELTAIKRDTSNVV